MENVELNGGLNERLWRQVEKPGREWSWKEVQDEKEEIKWEKSEG